MITSPAFAGKRYAVLGLARSGLAAVESLLASGAEVLAWDAREEPRHALEGRAALADPVHADLSGFAGVVVSPGVPLNRHPIAEAAARHGVPVIGDIELFALARPSLPPHKVVGITGTNGKSTTTALVTHILKQAGVPALMGGNIGAPILAQEPLTPNKNGVGVYVLELSSYQIDLTYSLDCDVAVILNITPDHLDRYDGFDAYAASKERLLDMQSTDDVIVFGSSFHEQRRHTYDRLFQAGLKVFCAPYYIMQDPFDLWDPFNNTNHLSVQKDWPALQGPHNAENAGAALLTCQALGIPDSEIDRGLRTYPGLPHRMERVAEAGGVLFVNDSKATNPASAAPALGAFPPAPGGAARIHWIVGGLPKDDDLDACAPYFANVAAAYAIGEAGPRFAELLSPHLRVERAEMMCEAIRRAIAAARPGDVVLLSPACASFDQFRDYEARGDTFRRLVDEFLTHGAVSCAPRRAAG